MAMWFVVLLVQVAWSLPSPAPAVAYADDEVSMVQVSLSREQLAPRPSSLSVRFVSWMSKSKDVSVARIEPDIFPDSDTVPMADDGDEGLLFFHAAPRIEWLILLCVCCSCALVDQCFPFFRNNHRVAIVFWITVGLAFNAQIWFRMGSEQGFSWTAGYILEWMLSMDNLFVFHLIFQTYHTPPVQRHKALFIGIVGAIAMRIVFFMAVSGMIGFFVWARYFFGALLIYSGIETARTDEEDADVKSCTVVVLMHKCLGDRLIDAYDEQGRIFVRSEEDQKLRATLLLVVIVCLEATDIVFAIDSVSAKVAQIPDQYIAFGSSALAMFGLRAMFFVVQELVDAFDLMKYGLCLILVFIGLELMCSQSIALPPSTMCVLIVAVIAVCIAGSKAKRKFGPTASTQDEIGKNRGECMQGEVGERNLGEGQQACARN